MTYVTDKIAIQGYKGSFHDLAINKLYGKKSKQVIYCKTIIDVFESLEKGLANYALTAIGNNRYGDVHHVYDILINNHLPTKSGHYYIVAEFYQNINYCLLANKGASIASIRTIYSQTPAIVECYNFINTRLRNALAVEQDDTALSAQLVSQLKNKSSSAIASKEAGKLFGLDVLAEDIQDDTNNIYRYLLLSLKKPKSYKNATKTSIILAAGQQSGALTKSLDLLVGNNINISYLQSMPIPNSPFEYRFLMDIDAVIEDKRAKKFFKELNAMGYQYNILGSYKKASLPRLKKTQRRVKSW